MELALYRSENLDTVTRIFVSAFTAPPLVHDFLNQENARRYIEDIAKSPGFLGYVFSDRGKACAFALGAVDNYFEGTIYQIKEFAVDGKQHRSGIGSTAMQLLEEKMAQLGVDAISLNTSRNLPAFAFYKKNGYETLEENVAMVKILEPRKNETLKELGT